MTREEAKQMFRDDKNSQGCYKAVLTKIDWIYDSFEKEQRELDYLEENCHRLSDQIDFFKNIIIRNCGSDFVCSSCNTFKLRRESKYCETCNEKESI